MSGERCDSALSGQEGVSREQEGVKYRTVRRTPELGKVHQVAKRVLNCQEDAESLGRRSNSQSYQVTKKVQTERRAPSI